MSPTEFESMAFDHHKELLKVSSDDQKLQEAGIQTGVKKLENLTTLAASAVLFPPGSPPSGVEIPQPPEVLAKTAVFALMGAGLGFMWSLTEKPSPYTQEGRLPHLRRNVAVFSTLSAGVGLALDCLYHAYGTLTYFNK